MTCLVTCYCNGVFCTLVQMVLSDGDALQLQKHLTMRLDVRRGQLSRVETRKYVTYKTP